MRRSTQMQRARKCLRKVFAGIRFTPSATTSAYGEPASMPPYSNMLATFSTDADEASLTNLLKELEGKLGDSPDLRRQGTVMMDIDLLEYGGERRHHDDWQRSYVKKLQRLLLLTSYILFFSFALLGQARAESGTVLLGKAIEYYQGRKYHESILAFEKLRRHYQLNPRFTAYLGFSYYKESLYEEAVACLTESIPQLTAYSPLEQAVYLYACAESHFYLSNYEQALPYYEQALPLTSGLDAADIHYHLAFCYYLQPDLVPADTLAPDTIAADTLISKPSTAHFLTANRLYKEAAALKPLSPLHAARLSQTTTMLRALIKQEE